jgi:hypothetical protein
MQIETLLPDTPFSFTLFAQSRRIPWYFAFLTAAGIAAVFFSRSRGFLALAFPVFPAMSLGGPSAFLFAALLAGILELLRAPLTELAAFRHYQNFYPDRVSSAGISGGFPEKIKPFKINCLLAALLFVVFAVFSIVSAPVSLVALAFLPLVFFFAFRLERRRIRKIGHIRFVPAFLFPARAKTFALFPSLLPFAAFCVFAVFLPPVLPPVLPHLMPDIFPSHQNSHQSQSPVDTRFVVSAEDYYRHVDFQRAFSFMPLDSAHQTDFAHPPLIASSFFRYYLGEDGLISGSVVYEPATWMPAPFPLEGLSRFLLNYDRAAVSNYSFFTVKEWVLMAIVFSALLVDFFLFSVRSPSLKTVSPILKTRGQLS